MSCSLTTMVPRPRETFLTEAPLAPLLDHAVASPHASLVSPVEQVVVIVDPLSTGVLLQKRLLESGNYRVVIVWSDRTQPACREKHFARAGFAQDAFAAVIAHQEGQLEDTLLKIIAAAGTMHIAAVFCGSEFGVLLEDQIANGLNQKLGVHHLKASGIPILTTKVDKHLQANLLRQAGLDAVRETLARTDDHVRAFLQANQGSKAFVVKPQTGAGSVGVTFCDSEQAVWAAFHKILAGQHKAHCGDRYRHYTQAGVLLQEYLNGTEYIVNAVVHNGTPKTTAMWKYDKRPYNGASFLCFSKELQVVSDENCQEIVEYTEKVLQAIGFQNGAIHAEIMYTNRGPVLVEVNCRLHGGNGAWVHPAKQCMGYDQLSMLMDVYLNDAKIFHSIPARPTTAHSYCHQVKMRSHVQGTLKRVIPEQWERILALPSYVEHVFGVRPGDQILKSVDMPSIPGEITLVHPDKHVLAADYQLLNTILAEGIFEVYE